MGFLKELLKAHEIINNEKSKADLCLYYSWNHNSPQCIWIGLMIIYCWGTRKVLNFSEKNAWKIWFHRGMQIKEYVGYKVWKWGHWRWYHYYTELWRWIWDTTGTLIVTGFILVKCYPKCIFTWERQIKCCSVMSKLFHLMQWTREEIYHVVCKFSCNINILSEFHYKAI